MLFHAPLGPKYYNLSRYFEVMVAHFKATCMGRTFPSRCNIHMKYDTVFVSDFSAIKKAELAVI